MRQSAFLCDVMALIEWNEFTEGCSREGPSDKDGIVNRSSYSPFALGNGIVIAASSSERPFRLCNS
jgi:hypothetical protein